MKQIDSRCSSEVSTVATVDGASLVLCLVALDV